MREVNTIITSTGTFPLALDWMCAPFATSLQVVIVGGTATYGLEFTGDNIMVTPSASVRWNSIAGLLPPGTTTSGVVQLTTPFCAVRCNVTAFATGPIEFKVIQGL